MFPIRANPLQPICLLALVAVWAASAGAEDVVLVASGERVSAPVRFASGGWKVGHARLATNEIIVVEFTRYPPPERIPAGIFIRGGSLIAGTLDSVIGEEIEAGSTSLSTTLKLKRADLAGAFFPLPTTMRENFPVLGRYGALVASLAPWPDVSEDGNGIKRLRLMPGRRDRVTYLNLDPVDGRLMRLGRETAILERLTDRKLESPKREALRLIECKVDAAEASKGTTPEVFVRLKGGDVLRGRIARLDENGLALQTAFLGTLELPRALLAALYATGAEGSGLAWLSEQKPVLDKHTPYFDAQFPSRLNLSCGGSMQRLAGHVADRGLGVHAKSELVYRLSGAAEVKLFALAGIDDETGQRGHAVVRVLVDGKVAFESEVRGGGEPVPVGVDLSGAKELKLVADFGPDEEDSGDHVDWAWAALLGGK